MYLHNLASTLIDKDSGTVLPYDRMKSENITSRLCLVINIINSHDLAAAVFQIEHELLTRFNFSKLRLLVVDSIVAPARTLYSGNASKRTKVIRQFGTALHRIANKFGIAVLCTNQLSTRYVMEGDERSSVLMPSLGNTWTSFLDTRLIVNEEKRLGVLFDN